MASADHPTALAAQTHRAARSCTLASRCALVSGTSPLTFLQQGGVSQRVRLGFAPRKAREVHRQCFASVSQSAVALYGVGSLRIVLATCATGGEGIRSSGKIT